MCRHASRAPKTHFSGVLGSKTLRTVACFLSLDWWLGKENLSKNREKSWETPTATLVSISANCGPKSFELITIWPDWHVNSCQLGLRLRWITSEESCLLEARCDLLAFTLLRFSNYSLGKQDSTTENLPIRQQNLFKWSLDFFLFLVWLETWNEVIHPHPRPVDGLAGGEHGGGPAYAKQESEKIGLLLRIQ